MILGAVVGRGTITTRKCSICGNEKPLTEFTRNRDKKDGHAYECLACHRLTVREQRRRDRLPSTADPHDRRPMMSDELFAVYYANTDLRRRIADEARILARDSREREEYVRDLQQIAWMHVSMCIADQSIDYYAHIGLKAMWNDRWKRRYRKEFGLESIECMSRAEYTMWSRGHY